MSDHSSNKRRHPESSSRMKRSSIQPALPNFLTKVYDMFTVFFFLNSEKDHANVKIITWGEDGNTLMIKKQTEFADKILPKYFKHSNLTSFIRQLNMYGFHKVKQEDNMLCFAHPEFHKGDKQNIAQIKRKVSRKEPTPESSEGVLDGLQDNIDMLGNRLAKLENHNQDQDWLVSEYQKLQ